MGYLIGGRLPSSESVGVLWLAAHRTLEKREREAAHRRPNSAAPHIQCRPRFSVEPTFDGWSSGGEDGWGGGGYSGGGGGGGWGWGWGCGDDGGGGD